VRKIYPDEAWRQAGMRSGTHACMTMQGWLVFELFGGAMEGAFELDIQNLLFHLVIIFSES